MEQSVKEYCGKVQATPNLRVVVTARTRKRDAQYFIGGNMWNKCTDRLPTKDGIYLTVEMFNGHNIYRIAAYRKNLGNVFGLDEYSGKSGFYDSDPEWGSFVIEPEAWKWIERYREKE